MTVSINDSGNNLQNHNNKLTFTKNMIIILNKISRMYCYQKNSRKQYLGPINKAFGEKFESMDELKKKRISNAFNRAGISFKAVNGLLGLDKTPAFAKADEVTAERPEAIRVWKEIEEWCRAAAVKRNLTWARFGFLGGYYSGMGVYHGKRGSADPSPGSVCGSQCRPVFQDCRAYEYSLCDLLMKKGL